MNRINDLISELRAVTERSRPNTMANDQLNLIEAIEHELNKGDDILPVESPVKDEAKEQVESSNEETSSENETPAELTPKRGRKSAKQD